MNAKRQRVPFQHVAGASFEKDALRALFNTLADASRSRGSSHPLCARCLGAMEDKALSGARRALFKAALFVKCVPTLRTRRVGRFPRE